jgi:hypothetical protein
MVKRIHTFVLHHPDEMTEKFITKSCKCAWQRISFPPFRVTQFPGNSWQILGNHLLEVSGGERGGSGGNSLGMLGEQFGYAG